MIFLYRLKVPSHNLASRFPALVLAVANANIGAGFLYFFYPQTTRANFRCSSRAANVIFDINLNTNIMRKFNFAKWLYKHFGIILPSLKDQWERDAEDIQFKLNNVRFEVNRYNLLHHTNYTSKKVVDILCK